MRDSRVRDELQLKRQASVRKKRIRLIAMVLLVLVTLAYAAWSIFYVMTRQSEHVRLSFLKEGLVDLYTDCSLVFLDEGILLNAPSGGLLVPLIADGERAAGGLVLALVVSPEHAREVDRLREARDAYEARLFILSGFADLTRYPSSRSSSDSRLRESIREITGIDQDTLGGPLVYGMEKIRHEFSQARSAAAGFAGQDEELARLWAEYEGVLEFLRADGQTRALVAPAAGEVCFSVSDLPALEPTLVAMRQDPQAVAGGLVEARNQPQSNRFRQVVSGQTVGSIRRFSGLSAACYLDNQTAEKLSLSKGSQVDLIDRDTGFHLEACRVEQVEKLGPGRLYLLSCPGSACLPPSFAALDGCKLVASRVRGLRVPLASLIDPDLNGQSADLMRVRGGLTEKVKVSIIAVDENYALVQSLESEERPIREADLYVVNPWSSQEGQLID